MIYLDLREKIRDLVKLNSTLLWLEGSKYEQVSQIRMKGARVVLSLTNGTTKLIHFEKYTLTSVGIQFWSQGRPGVLYNWNLFNITNLNDDALFSTDVPEDDPPQPPNMAA